MKQPSRRTRRWIAGLAIPAALVASAVIVWQSSYEAFTATTDSPNNQWSSGQLALTNDTSGSFAVTGSLMFNPSAIVPGSTGTWCVNVKNSGTVGSTTTNPVKFFAPLPASLSSNVLAQNLNLVVTEGTGATGGATGSCTGFTAGSSVYNGLISALPQSYAAATAPAGTGVIAVGGTKSYQLTWTMPSTTSNTAANQTLTGVDLAWGMQIGS